MQINSYETTQPIYSRPVNSPNEITPSTDISIQKPAEQGIQVSISAQAQQLAKSDNNSTEKQNNQPVQLPAEPKEPLTGERLEQAVKIKKAQMHYQVASDMVNIASNNNSGISASSAYYLSKNEDAREFVLDNKSQQQAMENMQAYQEQTAELNERYAQE